jgi:hypothetical protein
VTDPAYTDEQYAAAAGTVQAPPVGTTLADVPPGGSATEVDVAALIARMDAMAAQLAALQADKGAAGEHNLIGSAVQARNLIAQHFEFHHKGPDLTRLADDVVDAARNAVASGDAGPVRSVAAKLERALRMWSPGPGDHHYFRQAYSLIADALPDAADTVTEAQPSSAPAVSGGAPAKVVAGSVTG